MALQFSIIIPTFNRRQMLACALASVRAQDYRNVEIIVADGGSTDGTLDDIAGQPDIVLLPGPDRGLYDAINKGMRRAKGDIVGLLNTDDLYEPRTFRAVADAFTLRPDVQSVCGSDLLVENGETIVRYTDDRDKTLASPRSILVGACIPNARFFRRDAMLHIGDFDIGYHYIADRDWLMRWFEAGMITLAIPQTVYRYGQHEEALTFNRDRKHDLLIRAELIQLARRWRTDSAARRETRRIAVLLEGRCRGMLALDALRTGRWVEAANWCFRDGADRSLAPLAMIIRSFGDWLPARLSSILRLL